MKRACPVSLNFKYRYGSKAKLGSASIADLKLPTEIKNSKLNISRRGGRRCRPYSNEETQEKARFLLRFFICLPPTRHPCGGGRFIAVSGQKFFGVLSTFFSKKVLGGARVSVSTEPRAEPRQRPNRAPAESGGVRQSLAFRQSSE